MATGFSSDIPPDDANSLKREALKRVRIRIVNRLDVPLLLNMRCVHPNDKERIKAVTKAEGKIDGASEFLDLVSTRGDLWWDEFITTLRDSELCDQPDIADTLEAALKQVSEEHLQRPSEVPPLRGPPGSVHQRTTPDVAGVTAQLRQIQVKPRVYISYHVDDRTAANQIREKVLDKGFRTFMTDHNKGSETGSSKEVMRSSADVVVICMSRRYSEAARTKTEAKDAVELGKQLVFVKVRPKFKLTEWLKHIGATSNHFNFTRKTEQVHFEWNAFFKVFSKHGGGVVGSARAASQGSATVEHASDEDERSRGPETKPAENRSAWKPGKVTKIGSHREEASGVMTEPRPSLTRGTVTATVESSNLSNALNMQCAIIEWIREYGKPERMPQHVRCVYDQTKGLLNHFLDYLGAAVQDIIPGSLKIRLLCESNEAVDEMERILTTGIFSEYCSEVFIPDNSTPGDTISRFDFDVSFDLQELEICRHEIQSGATVEHASDEDEIPRGPETKPAERRAPGKPGKVTKSGTTRLHAPLST